MVGIDKCNTLLYNMARLKKLIWNDWNKNHIKKHKVTVSEIEEAYRSKTLTVPSYLGRNMIFGKTKQERFLTIIISYDFQGKPYVVSGRDMSKKERENYEN